MAKAGGKRHRCADKVRADAAPLEIRMHGQRPEEKRRCRTDADRRHGHRAAQPFAEHGDKRQGRIRFDAFAQPMRGFGKTAGAKARSLRSSICARSSGVKGRTKHDGVIVTDGDFQRRDRSCGAICPIRATVFRCRGHAVPRADLPDHGSATVSRVVVAKSGAPLSSCRFRYTFMTTSASRRFHPHHCGEATAPEKTSSMRRRVAPVTSAGSSSTAKNPISRISALALKSATAP